MKALKFISTTFRVTRLTITATLLAAMLMLNIATIAFSSVAFMLSAAFEAVTGVASVTSTLREDLKGKNKRIAGLEGGIRTKDSRITSLSDEVADTKLRNSRLDADINLKNGQIASLADEVGSLRNASTVTYRNQRVLLPDAVEHTAERISARTLRGATLNFNSMAAEAIPYLGIAVIVSMTAWDIKSSCDTMNDLHELNVAFNPANAVSDDHSEACGLTVPTKEELWQTAKDSPGKAWNIAKDAMPELPEFEAPKVNWTFWN